MQPLSLDSMFKSTAVAGWCQLASGLENNDLAQETGLCSFSTSMQHWWAKFIACLNYPGTLSIWGKH